MLLTLLCMLPFPVAADDQAEKSDDKRLIAKARGNIGDTKIIACCDQKTLNDQIRECESERDHAWQQYVLATARIKELLKNTYQSPAEQKKSVGPVQAKAKAWLDKASEAMEKCKKLRQCREELKKSDICPSPSRLNECDCCDEKKKPATADLFDEERMQEYDLAIRDTLNTVNQAWRELHKAIEQRDQAAYKNEKSQFMEATNRLEKIWKKSAGLFLDAHRSMDAFSAVDMTKVDKLWRLFQEVNNYGNQLPVMGGPAEWSDSDKCPCCGK
jgi:hypothetical protein